MTINLDGISPGKYYVQLVFERIHPSFSSRIVPLFVPYNQPTAQPMPLNSACFDLLKWRFKKLQKDAPNLEPIQWQALQMWFRTRELPASSPSATTLEIDQVISDAYGTCGNCGKKTTSSWDCAVRWWLICGGCGESLYMSRSCTIHSY